MSVTHAKNQSNFYFYMNIFSPYKNELFAKLIVSLYLNANS